MVRSLVLFFSLGCVLNSAWSFESSFVVNRPQKNQVRVGLEQANSDYYLNQTSLWYGGQADRSNAETEYVAQSKANVFHLAYETKIDIWDFDFQTAFLQRSLSFQGLDLGSTTGFGDLSIGADRSYIEEAFAWSWGADFKLSPGSRIEPTVNSSTIQRGNNYSGYHEIGPKLELQSYVSDLAVKMESNLRYPIFVGQTSRASELMWNLGMGLQLPLTKSFGVGLAGGFGMSLNHLNPSQPQNTNARLFSEIAITRDDILEVQLGSQSLNYPYPETSTSTGLSYTRRL